MEVAGGEGKVVTVDLTKSQAHMTADCKSDSEPIPPRIYSRFSEYKTILIF